MSRSSPMTTDCAGAAPSSAAATSAAAPAPLAVESDFYNAYPWCLNPHPTVGEVVGYLTVEIDKLQTAPDDWRADAAATNVYLLGCALLNSLDEHLRGRTLRLPRLLAARGAARGARWLAEQTRAAFKRKSLEALTQWRARWLNALVALLRETIIAPNPQQALIAQRGLELANCLARPLPNGLRIEQISVPSPFQRLDLTPWDAVELGRNFIARYPDRRARILLLGLRTSGSYFAPLIHALLLSEGYSQVCLTTLQPDKGAGKYEQAELARCAGQNYVALIVDDPPLSGGTIFLAFDIARRAGFSADRVKALAPTHPAGRDWRLGVPDDALISLAPERWRILQTLEPSVVEARLREYFCDRECLDVRIVQSERAAQYNAELAQSSSAGRGGRLKRIYELRLRFRDGREETRFVIAKSVGWGWLSYRAFLIGERLAEFAPPLIGLRDGILYSQYLPQDSLARSAPSSRAEKIAAAASYVAARVRRLGLQSNPLLGAGEQRHHNGLRLLGDALSRAYGGPIIGALARPRLARKLRETPCPSPTLIDGKMEAGEWIEGPSGPLKTDYEQHGLGKAMLNIVDPAYDLADVIMSFELSREEEQSLLAQYRAASGDGGVEQRLFPAKMLAGLWALSGAGDAIRAGRSAPGGRQGAHERFMRAWNFLTVETARRSGANLPPAPISWRAPLLFLDIDGVIDRRLFGFPMTSAAGLEALALLRRHGVSVALNSARSLGEVKDYCAAYGFAGGVAEYGACLWDATKSISRPLISDQAFAQLATLREYLRTLPGVYLDERHHYSIRAFVYRDKPKGRLASFAEALHSYPIGDGAVGPASGPIIRDAIAALKLDLLSVKQTSIDTTITARSCDKGAGLVALRDWVLGPQAETIAVGDSIPDLAMFAAAARSFAPANIDCARQAKLLGCQIVARPHQSGLLDIARALVHADGAACAACRQAAPVNLLGDDIFAEVLRSADEGWAMPLLRALRDPATYEILRR